MPLRTRKPGPSRVLAASVVGPWSETLPCKPEMVRAAGPPILTARAVAAVTVYKVGVRAPR